MSEGEGGERERVERVGEGFTQAMYSAIDEDALLIFPVPVSFQPQEVTFLLWCYGVYSTTSNAPSSVLSSLESAKVTQQSVALNRAL